MFNKKKVRRLERYVDVLKHEKLKEQERHEYLIDKHKKDSSETREKLEKLETKIREQTEADIYFECRKIMLKLEGGATKEDVRPQRIAMHGFRDQLQNHPHIASDGLFGNLGQAGESAMRGIFGI